MMNAYDWIFEERHLLAFLMIYLLIATCTLLLEGTKFDHMQKYCAVHMSLDILKHQRSMRMLQFYQSQEQLVRFEDYQIYHCSTDY